LTREDLEFLEALASDVAIAHENAALYERLRGEVITLRKVSGVAGIALVAFGLIIGVGATLAHLAHALPLSELAARSGIWTAGVLAFAGAGLIGMGRGWIVARAA
jgi:GAF domain-containing protein